AQGSLAAPAAAVRNALAGLFRPLATAERALPLAVAAIVAIASLLALLPGQAAVATGGTSGRGQGVRIAVNGGNSADGLAAIDQRVDGSPGSFVPVVIPADSIDAPVVDAPPVADTGAFLADGTLLTGYTPQTAVDDGADTIVKYKVKSGDTLSGVARRFGVSMMTLWWANKLKSKDALHIGQVLRIPPVSGLVVTVGTADTMESIAAKYGVKVARIMAINGLSDDTLVVGQVLVLPGAHGAPIPTPKPTPKPRATSHSGGSAGHSTASHYTGGPAHYTGGRFHWPVVGGNNYISQYFHYGHIAIDIAADYGSKVVAAAGGRVAFAGWKSNGGGWQVWINHGNGTYTTYNHMSGLTVGTGQFVGKGQQVGRIGATGNATGPHLHFEVWVGGEPWQGTAVNPMRYF
ncbi:MAG: M23 family metallopeptidase, partial [Chloroflexota bacterium]